MILFFMDKEDRCRLPSRVPADGIVEPTAAERRELLRRSQAHRRNPDVAVSLDDALESIERSLEMPRGGKFGPTVDADQPQS
jgi:hypothetical protein